MRMAILGAALIAIFFIQIFPAYATKGQSDGMKFQIRILSPEEIKRQKEIEQKNAAAQDKAKETKSTKSTAKSEPSEAEKAYRKKMKEKEKTKPEPTKRWE
ncbi:MAG: hypothetical protein ABH871_04160 [Pseudomonadota bacterium]